MRGEREARSPVPKTAARADTHDVVHRLILGLLHGVEALQALLLEALELRGGSLCLGRLVGAAARRTIHGGDALASRLATARLSSGLVLRDPRSHLARAKINHD